MLNKKYKIPTNGNTDINTEITKILENLLLIISILFLSSDFTTN